MWISRARPAFSRNFFALPRFRRAVSSHRSEKKAKEDVGNNTMGTPELLTTCCRTSSGEMSSAGSESSLFSRQDTSDDVSFEDALDTHHDSSRHRNGSEHEGSNNKLASRSTPPPPALAPVTPSSEVSTHNQKPAGSTAHAASDVEPRRLDPELAGLEKEHEDETGAADHDITNDTSSEVSKQQQQEKEQQQSSTEEIDLLIEQLDQIESEYSAKLNASQTTLHEKDAIIGALGHNLTELKDGSAILQNELQQERDTVQLLQDELVRANAKVFEAREEKERLSNEHKMILEQEIHRLEAKAARIEKDVCNAAKEQFAQAKLAYDTLLEERDELMFKRDALSRELQMAREESAKREAHSKSKEADLLARIAELKAEIASANAETVAVRRDYKIASDEAQGRISSLEDALQRSNEDRAATQHALASAKTNRERLEKENTELNALCEELMRIVEGRGDGEVIGRNNISI